MDNKGQVSVELLFIILIFLIILSSVTIPLISNGISSSMNVSTVSDAKNAVVTIGNAVNIVYADGPGATRTLSVYIPQNMSVSANNNILGMSVNNLNYTSNGNTMSNKYVNTSIDYSGNIPAITLGSGWHNLQVNMTSNNGITITKLT